MAKLPDSVQIGDRNFYVILVPASEMDELDELGDVDIKDGIIRIRNDLSPYTQFETLLHEILHVIFAQTKLDNGRYKSVREEDIIERIDGILYKTLVANGWMPYVR